MLGRHNASPDLEKLLRGDGKKKPAARTNPASAFCRAAKLSWCGMICFLSGLDWIGLDWIGLDWIGLDWIGLDWIGLDWIGLDSLNCRFFFMFRSG